MSHSRTRSAVKSQPDLGGRGSSADVSPPALPDPGDEYIIPGRMTVRQWSNALLEEEAEDVVGEIMTELLTLVMDGCLKSDLKKQVVPFTVNWAKTYLIQVLRPKFICREEKEEAEESSKTEDSQSMPPILDNWAQGCFPILQITRPSTSISLQAGQHGQTPEPRHQGTRMARLKKSAKQTEKESVSFRPEKGAIQTAKQSFLPKLVESKQAWSPPQPKEKKDQERNNLGRSVTSLKTQLCGRQKSPAIPRLHMSNLPKHWIVPQCQIVDQSNLTVTLKKPAGHMRVSENQKESWKNQSRLTSHVQYDDQPGEILLKNEAAVWSGKLSPSCQKRSELISAETVDLARRVSLMAHQTVRLSRAQFNASSLSGFS
ncbi:uncharacterized protein C2orf81-like [Synchiropus splendidus]|uniref:uncharacterized protein C2orf81-like n=1 Tax=Synchiropus splendidus TaxID=270530 RepID=UPI00237E277F|nr:uncharacterized protein C2orf81-like [Synchiropus splendidus]